MTINKSYSKEEYIINHVFMPQRLPQEAEQDDEGGFGQDHELAMAILDCANEYKNTLTIDEGDLQSWAIMIDMLQAISEMHKAQPYSADNVAARFGVMQSGSITAILVRKQNAGLIIRQLSDTVVFEAFEASPPPDIVLAATGKVIVTFPGPCVSIPLHVFQDPFFRSELASFLAQMNVDRLDESMAHTEKAGSKVQEVRYPADPRMITDLLMKILAAVESKEIVSATKIVTKRLGDDVLWMDAYEPWRRSSLWLVIRVALQTSLAPVEYKRFMLYAMASISKRTTSLSNDFLEAMRAKLSRRMVKLKDAPPILVDFVRKACQNIHDVMLRRWEKWHAEAQDISPLLDLTLKDVVADTRLELTGCFEYIDWSDRSALHITSSSYTPTHKPRCNEWSFSQTLEHKLDFAFGEDVAIGLHDFEEQVARNLGVGSGEFNDIQALLENLKAYFAIADKYYDENPEDQSIMLLTVFEMWRAIDRVAIREIPLLGEYPPEVSYKLIENLLLRKAKDLKRAMDLIKYLKTREHNARSGYPSVFATVEWTSFSIRYYDSESSRVMQDLMTSIDQHAATKEQRKADEREEKRRDRDRLERLAREASHTYSNYYDHRWWNCNKCIWEDNAKNISIDVYEWPLPRHHNHDRHRKNIVFELCCPEYFSQWREATVFVLFDILTPPHARPGDDTKSQHTLMSYYTQDRMGHTPISNLGSRITLASRTKSFGDSHYRSVHIQDCHSLTTAVVNHGMTWELFDTSTKSFITQQYHAADTLWRCTYTIPGDEKKLYGALAFTLCTTAHTENEVLAKQEKCAQGITLHEFVAYGCLRSGKHIQWQNILRAIATHSLTFRREAVHALISHAVQQIGGATVEGNSLERHLDLMSEAFCKRLLEVVGALVEDISGNWKELRTLRTVVLLLLRVLASPANPAISEEADRLLRLARTTAFRWLKETLARSDSDSHGSNAMVSHICEIALTLRLTYDVVDQLMSTEDKCTFVFCGIVIHDRSPSKRDTSHKPTRVLVDRSQRLSCLYEEQLLASFASLDSDAFDQAVVLVWPPFQRVSEPWTRLDGNNKRWISCHTTTGGQLVQLNILDGRLLVDGKPIGLLPKSITQHVTYRRLFENATLRVIPAGISGWEYKTVQPVGVWEIFFALRGENLAIRSRNTCTGTFMEHIPCEKLTADLPTPFVEDYVHWMDTATQSIDLRLLDNMWGVQAKWCINLDTHEMSLQQVPTPQHLIEPRSLTFQCLLSQHLRRLEHPSFVIAVLHSDQYIRVSLPRFKLVFSVNVGGTPGPLKCETFSGMVVDRDQSIPTWHGLQTKLVLKEPATSNGLFSPRRFLLVPNGSIAYNTDDLRSHVNVTIDTDPSHSRHVQYFRYEVDSALCLLRCSGSLESQLYKSYLHALTSNGIPDTLTGRTGVEEALSVINSATCQSFMRLSHRDIELLNSIRKLTPVRHYYPPRREVMQTIDWLDLPASSQRAAYARRVDALIAYDCELALFSDAPPNLLAVNSPVHLLNRAGARESLFPLINILNVCTTPYSEDKHHNQADSTTIQSDCSAYATARMVCSGLMVGTFMPVGTNSAALNLYPSFFEKWENMTTGHAETAQLSYSRVWLSRTDFGATWLSLYQSCCSDTLPLKQKTFKLLFSLPAFAITLASSEYFDLAPCLMAFASHPSVFTRISVPVHATYELSFGTEPSQARIARIVQNQQHPLSETPSYSLPQHWNEEPHNHYDRRHSHYNDECATLNREITERLVRTWHQRTWCGSICPGSAAGYFNINVIDHEARLLFDHCLHNGELRDYADRVEVALNTLHLPSPVTYHTDDHVLSMRLGSPAHHTEMQSRVLAEYSALTLNELVSRREPPCIVIPLVSKTIGTPSPNPVYYSSEGALMLRDLLTSFCEQFDSGLEYMYGSSVRKSLDNIESRGRSLPGHVDMVGGSGLDSPFAVEADNLTERGLGESCRKALWKCVVASKWSVSGCLRGLQAVCNVGNGPWGITTGPLEPNRPRLTVTPAVGTYYACRHQFEAQLLEVKAALEPRFHWEHVIDAAGLWPLRDIRTILAQFQQKQWRVLNVEWKRVLIHLAHSLLRYQQCERIIRFTANSMTVDLEKELKTSCDVDIEFSMQHPDDLLIQIENNFLAREVQKTITAEMLEPTDRPNMENVLYQLNMGEGKSTVIVPMVATSVADGQRLARIIVLKPLVKQMFQLLTQRVSEFPNRRVCYFPFSRQMKMGREQFQRIRRLYEECMEDGAILIALPEHILSAKLLSIDRVLAGPSSTDRGPMEEALGFQRWQKQHSRDILDESDELLHIRYQLIYTMGAQKVLEPAPARWKIVQEVLACFAKHVLPLSDELNDPSVLQVNSSDVWAFPSVKLPQRHQISSSIVGVILDDIMEGHLQSIIIPASQSLKDAIKRYLTTVDDDECQDAREELDRQLGNDATFQMVLVLRGLLLHGLLIYALRDRRWRVDYGLDLSRSMLAVPFRAKDVPSPRAEFGHPDIAVLLTCLSYYYGGLTHDQIDTCVKHLLSQSSPQLHYDIWIEDVPREHLSSDLIDPAGINSDDPEQCTRVYALFQYNRNVINFYLNNVVFPRCAKQFEHKLPCSAWDLAEKKKNITTGFSGTNDNRYLLPTSTRQAELAAQAGTSALVLTHLLHPANTAYVCAAGADGTTLSGSALISTVASYPEIRVLLDVGAQILDLSNKAVAQKWLECTSHEAAIFFDGDDELMVITKEGARQPLQSSPYRDESGIAKCVVYLDDAHTRGTDLRLPRHWRAAVTLGKKVTKDRLAQGCMRMRQFGNGQTITFFAPPDIDIAARVAAGKQHHQDVEVVDVVRWAMLETCADIRHHTASWAQQGIDHRARSQALDSLPDSPSEDDVVPVRNAWLQPEARTLKEMYYLKPTLDLGDEVPKEIMDRLNEIGLQTPTRADMDEEQEREVTHEIEEERQQEAPPPAIAAISKFTPALLTLVENKSLALSSFRCLGNVLAVIPSWKADHSSSNSIFSPQLLVTPDFEETILSAQRADLMKPVQWILATTTLNPNYLILVSQFEANGLISMLKKLGSTHIQLHMYCPRVAKTMPVFDNLMFHSIPSTFQGDASLADLILQVNIFAGQLYPTSWADFNRLCDFLGIANDPDRHPIAANDRFVLPVNRDVRMVAACRFDASPIRFLKDLVALRRKGQEFELTPIGRLLAGHRLFEEDFL